MNNNKIQILDFFQENTIKVARSLLGKIIKINQKIYTICETEAYRGCDDPASHAFKKTQRSAIMYGPPGICYVYIIYGIYYCLNFTTEPEGKAGAVLIRGIIDHNNKKIIGPGLVCKKLQINKQDNKKAIGDRISLYNSSKTKIIKINELPRIGIKKAKENLWRFQISKY